MHNYFAYFLTREFWQRHMICQTRNMRTTWKLRLLVACLLLILTAGTQRWWIPLLGWSLVSNTGVGKADLILVDNLDLDYRLFEKAADLIRSGIGRKVLIPVFTSGQDIEKPNEFSLEITEVFIRLAGLESVEVIPIKEVEPVTFNAAHQVGDFLKGTNTNKVLILTSGFKSRRLHLIFSKVLGEMGIETDCLPVWGSLQPESWAKTWHGIQEVLLQHAKLAYYRLLVL